jgi:hypothetical protein
MLECCLLHLLLMALLLCSAAAAMPCCFAAGTTGLLPLFGGGCALPRAPRTLASAVSARASSQGRRRRLASGVWREDELPLQLQLRTHAHVCGSFPALQRRVCVPLVGEAGDLGVRRFSDAVSLLDLRGRHEPPV